MDEAQQAEALQWFVSPQWAAFAAGAFYYEDEPDPDKAWANLMKRFAALVAPAPLPFDKATIRDAAEQWAVDNLPPDALLLRRWR
jgi:hypothetical protein